MFFRPGVAHTGQWCAVSLGFARTGRGSWWCPFSSSINYAEVRALEVVDETP